MNLKKVAPEKNYADIITPMNYLTEEKFRYTDEKKHFKKTPLFLPAGQSTQLIVGATSENDQQILQLANNLYTTQKLKRACCLAPAWANAMLSSSSSTTAW